MADSDLQIKFDPQRQSESYTHFGCSDDTGDDSDEDSDSDNGQQLAIA